MVEEADRNGDPTPGDEHSVHRSGHVPVLLREVVDALRPAPGGRFIDGTLGAGGHAAGLLRLTAPDGRLLGIDRDPAAVAFAARQLAVFGERATLVAGSFGDVATIAVAHGFDAVDGVLLDLGLSSRQLADAERGFSFLQDGPLDMRFDTRTGITAADLINNLSAEELANLFFRYGEEQQSRRIARLIIAHRPMHTTGELAGLIATQASRSGRPGRHPATKVFQALRIAVNDELKEIERGLHGAVERLRPGGRLAVISFHSLEDRLVKQFLRQASRDCNCPPRQPVCTCGARPLVRLVSRKAIKATDEEIAANPRSRSARLRIAAKVATDEG